jgi:hypothetical protein
MKVFATQKMDIQNCLPKLPAKKRFLLEFWRVVLEFFFPKLPLEFPLEGLSQNPPL